jgi:mRNA interferase RelE/StbE
LKVEFKSSFAKDLRKIKAKRLKSQVRAIISAAEEAQNILEIEKVKKLRGIENYYRIRIGDYRIGCILEDDTIIFVRFLHRKDIYRYFP